MVLLLAHLWLYQRLRQFVLDYTFGELESKAELATTLLSIVSRENPHIDLQELARRVKMRVGTRVTFIRKDGQVLADSDVPDVSEMDNHRNRPEIQQALKEKVGKSYRFSQTTRHRMFYVAIKQNGLPFFDGILRLSYYSERVHQNLAAVKAKVTASFFLFAFLFLTLGSALLFAIWHPFDRFNLEMKKIITRREQLDLAQLPSGRDWRSIRRGLENLVSDQAKVEKELAFRSQLLDGVFRTFSLPAALVDRSGKILEISTRFSEIFAGGRELRSDQKIHEILRLPELEGRLRDGPFPAEFSMELLSPEGRRTFRCIISSFQAGDEAYRLLQFFDETELKKLRAIRRDFVANVSHELKTPLTSLIGMLDTLNSRQTLPPKKAEEFLHRCFTQAKRMEQLVLDLLKLSELDQGKALHRTAFRVKELFSEILRFFHPQAEKKGLQLQLDLPDPDLLLTADRQQIREVLENLVQNAIQYTNPGGTIRMSAQKHNGHVKFEVQDTGIGINRKFHQRIFQRFYRVDAARSMHPSGTGLGLAIARHIVELHGGEIGVESEPGKGSTFWFTVPVEPPKRNGTI